jgi:hypothetical protein
MYKYLFPALLLAMCEFTFAQSVFTVDGTLGTKVFTSIDSALSNAQNGDYIYCPAGAFNISGGLQINKKVNIIGAGHYPDSTQATGQTVLTGNIYLLTDASGGLIQGIYLNGDLLLGNNASNSNVKNYSITRCNISILNLSFNGSSNGGAENILFKDNILRSGIAFGGATNVIIETNIIAGNLSYGNGSVTLRNNVFLFNGDNFIYYLSSCEFENNVILNASGYFSYGSAANIFRNNVFKSTNRLLPSDLDINNMFNVDSLFVNQTGYAFQYNHNYHLKNGSPAIGAGLAGTDCGIYGGNNPYKEGAVPVNPHILLKNLPSQTDAQGKLNIQVKVAAQNN